MTITIEPLTDNIPRRRFEMQVDGHLAFADYRIDGETLFIPHVEAAPELRGTGAAGRLMEAVMRTARARQLKVVPICGYAATWIDRHAEYRALLR